MTLADVKSYLRVDYADDDELIQSLICSAESYLQRAGVPEMPDDARYQLAVKALVGHYYDNRGSPGVPAGVRELIIQLRGGL